ncbi:MAG: outer membrane protein assembly factor [Alphaproteobacteria bacterium]|nr:outer membrane protein assembly factor [Alphaproteobacteria bacterium]
MRRCVTAALVVAALNFGHDRAAAQGVDGLGELNAPLDPSAPLDPMPGLGVDWPTLNDQPSEEQPGSAISQTPTSSIADEALVRSYNVRLEGLGEVAGEELTDQFNQLSTLQANRDDPANAAQIDRRAREDADLLAELLRAHGYYDALVDTKVEAEDAGRRVTVTLVANPGPLYHFAEVRLPGLEQAGDDAPALREAFAVKPQDPVESARVITGEAALRLALGDRGYPFAEVGARDIVVDHGTRTATLTMPVQPNGRRQFGRITVEGKKLFSARHIQTIARFRTGDRYAASRIDDLRRALIATGLVSSATIRPVARQGSEVVDIAVALEPAPVHTVAGEIGYGTGEGLRLEASWQHRNMIKPEGAVTIRGVAGTREQLIGASLRQNNFRRRDQVLTAQAAISHVRQDAYTADTFQMGAGIERETNIIWQKKWTWSLGTELVASDEKDVDVATATTRHRTFLIGALPTTLSYDGSNDLLDPTKGFRLSGRLSPELSLQNGAFGYARAQIDGSFYQPVSSRVVIATRVRLGTIVGASRDRIAPSRRFYAGGGGSVRGYGYQDLGPRDPIFNDPIGGRSLAEFALEARVRVGNFGIVPFVDAGNIYTSPLPHLDSLRFGTGIGLRYHSNFGPIRIDVGTPIARRSGEPRIAVYVSLGQAF